MHKSSPNKLCYAKTLVIYSELRIICKLLCVVVSSMPKIFGANLSWNMLSMFMQTAFCFGFSTTHISLSHTCCGRNHCFDLFGKVQHKMNHVGNISGAMMIKHGWHKLVFDALRTCGHKKPTPPSFGTFSFSLNIDGSVLDGHSLSDGARLQWWGLIWCKKTVEPSS